ncbi:MAG: DUF4393 domain-containing protein [Verrucomicrobia bacterium]|nr:DUF4393 domain-containing protein [Verrucomicrobiota bacterium]
MTNKIDITSTAIEKGIDLAKDFLDKLIIPTVEETGLLLRDKVTMWRFNNQVKMLIKAKENCEKHGINPKTVSLKVLCPLLDYAGLEENEILQDKWANLLTNMVDSSQNIENHVFPYLLSQVSVDEFMMVEAVYKMRLERIKNLENELKEFLTDRPNIERELKEQISELERELKEGKEKKPYDFETQRKKWDKEKELRELDNKERTIRSSIKQPELIPSGELREYEISNLIRLGIIKSVPRPYAYVGEHRIQNNPDSEYLYLQDLEITMEAEEDDLILTELGELFIAACNEKR